MHNDFTQSAGLLALVPAALTSAIASKVLPSRKRERLSWALIALIHALLAIEIVAMTRFRVDRTLIEWLRAAGIYSERRPLQAAVIVVALTLAATTLFFITRLMKTRYLFASGTATVILVTVFVVESVSLHAIDAMLYQFVGYIMLIAWLWAGCGLVTIIAAGQAITDRQDRNYF